MQDRNTLSSNITSFDSGKNSFNSNKSQLKKSLADDQFSFKSFVKNDSKNSGNNPKYSGSVNNNSQKQNVNQNKTQYQSQEQNDYKSSENNQYNDEDIKNESTNIINDGNKKLKFSETTDDNSTAISENDEFFEELEEIAEVEIVVENNDDLNHTNIFVNNLKNHNAEESKISDEDISDEELNKDELVLLMDQESKENDDSDENIDDKNNVNFLQANIVNHNISSKNHINHDVDINRDVNISGTNSGLNVVSELDVNLNNDNSLNKNIVFDDNIDNEIYDDNLSEADLIDAIKISNLQIDKINNFNNSKSDVELTQNVSDSLSNILESKKSDILDMNEISAIKSDLGRNVEYSDFMQQDLGSEGDYIAYDSKEGLVSFDFSKLVGNELQSFKNILNENASSSIQDNAQQQIIYALKHIQNATGYNSLSLKLHPEDLGEVSVKLHYVASTVKVTQIDIKVSKDNTLALFQDIESRLVSELRDVLKLENNDEMKFNLYSGDENNAEYNQGENAQNKNDADWMNEYLGDDNSSDKITDNTSNLTDSADQSDTRYVNNLLDITV